MTLAPSPPSGLRDDPGYPSLKDHILQVTGLWYYADKEEDLTERIARRLVELEAANCEQYLRLLGDPTHGKAELDRLVERLTVGETSFFRHAELFDGIRDRVLPDILKRNRTCKRLRIWSAGCSIGAEAYSLAIMLSRDFGRHIDGWDVSILGTDINRKFLARASQGVFRQWDFRGVAQAQIKDCFTRRDDEWVIRPEYRRWVSFQYQNLVQHSFPSLLNNLVAFDLILCRNVVIYFSRDVIERLVGQFHECLVDGGWLLVGHAEPNIELFRSFQTVNVPGAVLYQKTHGALQDHAEALAPLSFARNPESSAAAEEESHETKAQEARVSDDTAPRHVMPNQRPTESTPRPAMRSSCDTTSGDELGEWLRRADTGDLDAAMHGVERLAAKDPMNPMLHLHMGMIAEQVGDRKQAETALRHTLYLDPSNALAHYYYGLHHQRHALRTEAARSFQNALKCLSDKQEGDSIPAIDGLTVVELRELTRMQLEVLRKS